MNWEHSGVPRFTVVEEKANGPIITVSLSTQVFLHAMLHFICVLEDGGISSVIMEPVFCGWIIELLPASSRDSFIVMVESRLIQVIVDNIS